MQIKYIENKIYKNLKIYRSNMQNLARNLK